MVVFDNMHHMGGYSWRPHNYDGSTYLEIGRSEALVDRMLAKRKPAAECVVAGNWSFRYDRDERRAHQAKRDAITKLHERASRGDLVVGAIHTGHLAGVEYPWSYRFTMAQPGTSSDNFDLDAWKSSWLGYKMPEPYLASWLEEIDGVPLSHLIELFRENEHSLPAPIVGLILGFPICTTASLV
jgi:hypothetical protein